MFTVHQISTGYRNRLLHEGITFTVNKGGFVSLLGRNGAGKSSLLRVLAGLQKPQAGIVYLNEVDVHKMNLQTRAEMISVVNTERPDLPWFTVQEFISLGRIPYRKLSLTETDKVAIEHAMHLTGVERLAHSRLNEISDGERQRTAIGRALAQDTPVMILDEPVANLDPFYRRDIMTLLKDLAEKEGKVIIAATHEIELAKEFSHNAVILSGEGQWLTKKSENIALSDF